MSGDPPSESGATPESDAREEAEWELIAGHTLRGRGDLDGAAAWFRRAVEHLMDAGDDERALEVARMAAELRAQPAPSAPVPPPPVPPPPVPPPVPAPPRVVIPLPSESPAAPSARPSEPTKAQAYVVPMPAVAPVAAPAAAPIRGAVSSPASSRRPLSHGPERAAQSDHMAVQLSALPVFADMPVESLRALSRQVTELRFAVGEVLIEGGSSDGPMLVLTEGTAKVSATHQRTALDTAGVGDMVGEIAICHGGIQVTTVVAETAVTAVAFPPSLVRALAREFQSFRATLDEVISDRAYAALPGNAGLLRAMPSTARESVYALFEPVLMREGDALFTEGISASAVWLVAAGEVEIYGGDLGARALQRALAGTALCVGPVLSNEPCGVSARALRDVLLARIGAASFRGLAAQFPEIGHSLADIGVPGREIAC